MRSSVLRSFWSPIYRLAVPAWIIIVPLHFFALRTTAGLISSVLFYAGLALILGNWAKKGKGPLFVRFLIVLIVMADSVALIYRKTSGVDVPLDFSALLFGIGEMHELSQIVSTEVSPGRLAVVFLIPALYFLMAYIFHRRDPRGGRGLSRSRMSRAGLALLTLSLFPLAISQPLRLNSILYLMVSAFDVGDSYADEIAVSYPSGYPPVEATLLPDESQHRKKNLVFVVLESTRWRDSTFDDPRKLTTPFLYKLAKQGVSAERMYTTFPHTSKALVSILCGIDPYLLMPMPEASPKGIPARCLPEMLGEQGYKTVYFQTAVEFYEKRPQLVQNMGFQEFYPGNRLPSAGLEKANYFGFEDKILLGPSKEWLEKNKQQPFMAVYLTNAAHHPYGENKRMGTKAFAAEGPLNRYLNAMNYQDQFLEQLITDYREMGLEENTIFVILGDHGQAFGEHRLNYHNAGNYEEFIRIPLVILDPDLGHEHLPHHQPVSQLDLVPTITHLMGYEIVGADYPGVNFLEPIAPRMLFTGCYIHKTCIALTTREYKYIHNFGRKEDEYYDLLNDPGETKNLIRNLTESQRQEFEKKLLAWYRQTNHLYETYREPKGKDLSRKPPIKLPRPG